MTRRKTRKKPNFLAVPIKVTALAEVFSGASIAGTARKYGVSPGTVACWKRGGFKWKDGNTPTGILTVNGKTAKTKTNGRLMNLDTYNAKRYTSTPKITHYNKTTTTGVKTNIGVKIKSVNMIVNGKRMVLTPNDIRDISALEAIL